MSGDLTRCVGRGSPWEAVLAERAGAAGDAAHTDVPRKKKFKGLIVASVAFAAVSASAAVYTGSLSYADDGFYAEADGGGAQNWTRHTPELRWTVRDDLTDGPEGFNWFYSYEFEVGAWTARGWMIETGLGFTTNDIASVNVSVSEGLQEGNPEWSIGLWTSDDFNQMPESRYGIQFSDTSSGGMNSSGVVTVSFWSTYGPQWADMLVNCGGGGNRGWNEGFTLANPTDDPSSGSIDNHVLTPLPEPAVALLLALACFLTLVTRRIIDPDCRRALFSR